MNILYEESTGCENATPVEEVAINSGHYRNSPDKEFQRLRNEWNQLSIKVRDYLRNEYKKGQKRDLNLAECEEGML